MSALLYLNTPEHCLLGMDTMARTPNGEVEFRTSKFLLVPHLHMVMCCTGIANLMWEWHNEILKDGWHVGSIDDLDRDTPRKLTEIAVGIGLEIGSEDAGKRVTVYHFGYSPVDRAMVGYAYRSTEHFASQRLEYSYGFKPPEGVEELYKAETQAHWDGERSFSDVCIKLISAAKAIDDQKSPSERLNIGGEILVLSLKRDLAQVITVHRFPDADTIPASVDGEL
jgi:hypothetical protein